MLRDIFGEKLNTGDVVAYGVRHDNSGDLNVGIIKEIDDSKGILVRGITSANMGKPYLNFRDGWTSSRQMVKLNNVPGKILVPLKLHLAEYLKKKEAP